MKVRRFDTRCQVQEEEHHRDQREQKVEIPVLVSMVRCCSLKLALQVRGRLVELHAKLLQEENAIIESALTKALGA